MASLAVHDHHKRLLVKLSDKLTREDREKIVFLQNLPKKLEGKSPLKVLTQLVARGKTIEDIIEILKDINRYDVAKEAEELHILERSQESLSDRKDSRLEAKGDLALAVKLDDQQLDYMCSKLKEVLRQSYTPSPAPLLTQSLTDSSEWKVVPSTHYSTVCNKCSQMSVTAECSKSPLLTRASQYSQGAKKPLLPPQKKMMGSPSSSWSNNNREDNGKHEYTMPGVSGVKPLHEEKPHRGADFLTDLNYQLKRRFETTPPASGSSRIDKPPGKKPPLCPAKLLPPARLRLLEGQPSPAKPTPPPKPIQTTTAGKDINVRSARSDIGDSGFFDSNSLPKHSLHYSVVPVPELCSRLQSTSGYAPVLTSEVDPENCYH